MPTFVEISAADLEALATDSDDADAVVRLTQAEYSRRALLLRAIAERVPTVGPESLPSMVDRSFTLLSRAEAGDRTGVRRLLLYPTVGEWAAHTIRALGRPRSAGPDPDLGHLASIAASAAIGVVGDFTISVPIRSGRVVLPMRGTARLDGEPDGTVDVVSRAGRVSVRGGLSHVDLPTDRRADGDGWRALRHVGGLCGGSDVEVLIDDQDPYRRYDGLVPETGLDDDAHGAWRKLISGAWDVLERHPTGVVTSMLVGMRCVVPLASGTHGVSATSGDAFGAAAMSLPRSAVDVALGLVHEFQHSKLSALLHHVELHADDGRQRYYAPWRSDPRPLAGLLHGCYAFMGVAGFWRSQRRVGPWSAVGDREFARWREEVWRTTNVLLASAALGPPGRLFVEAMRTTLQRWRAEPVPMSATRAARQASLDHRSTWSIRNPDLDDAPNRPTG